MIAEIAKTLAVLADDKDGDPPVCVVEAGTGTGKTLAYVLAVLPLAQALEYKVVIATATVALQEQVVLKDIPEILAGSDLDFSYALAKGRGRYLCLSKLDSLLRGDDSMQAMMDLYGEALDDPGGGDHALYQKMLDALSAGNDVTLTSVGSIDEAGGGDGTVDITATSGAITLSRRGRGGSSPWSWRRRIHPMF